MKLLFSEFYNSLPQQIIEEGGAYGHMANIHEKWNLSFWDLKHLIRMGLSGGVSKEVKEKTDGQALAFSYTFKDVDKLKGGKIVFARNAGHYRKFGKGAMRGAKGVADQFLNHPVKTVKDTFTFAAKDLEQAFDKLDPEVLYELFHNGARWVNIEIIWPENENVIPYGDHNLLVLHNYREYDQDGNTLSGDFNNYGDYISKILRKVNLDVQDKFKITSMPILKIPEVADFDQHITRLTKPIDEIQSEFNITDDDIVGEYWVKYMTAVIRNNAKNLNYNLDSRLDLIDKLAYRWAFGKSKPRPADYSSRTYRTISELKKDLPVDQNYPDGAKQFAQWVSEQDKSIANTHAQMLDPIRLTFAEVGMYVIRNISSLLTLNPTNAAAKIRRRLDDAIAKASASDDPKTIETLDKHLKTIQSLGGLEAIVPTEGVTFTYTPRGSSEQIIFKYTGNFGAINQILGMATYGR